MGNPKQDTPLVSPYGDESCAGGSYTWLLPSAARGPGAPPAWLLEPSLLCPSQAAAFPFAGTGHQRGPPRRWPQAKCSLQLCLLRVGLAEEQSTDQLVQLDVCKQITRTRVVWGRYRLSLPLPAASPRHTGCGPWSHSSR